MNHTPEPWHLPKGSTCMESNSGEVPRSEANARRIVACVNACEGMDTDSLESIAGRIAAKSVLQMHANYVGNKAKSASLEQQRDKLLAAMVELVDDLEARAIDGVVPCGRSAYAKAKSALTGEPMLEYF